MRVAVVDVGVVRVAVDERRVAVAVDVRLARRVERRMGVPVMLVMHVGVLVNQLLVAVLVLVMLGEMEPEPRRHQRAGDDEARRDRVAEQQDREQRADERRR